MVAIVISVASLIITLLFNLVTEWNHISDLEPLLTFDLYSDSGVLYLSICNTGKSDAKSIIINIKEIKNNGNANELELDCLFNSEFELYPNEAVQGMIGFFGKNIETYAFPSVKIDVSYIKGNWKVPFLTGRLAKCRYSRTVTFSVKRGTEEQEEKNNNKNELMKRLTSLSQSNVRIANYLDGHTLLYFDNINPIYKNSLKNDLLEVLQAEKRDAVKGQRNNLKENKEEIKGERKEPIDSE